MNDYSNDLINLLRFHYYVILQQQIKLAMNKAVNTSTDVTALPLVNPLVNTTTDVTSIAVAKPQKAKRKQYLNTKNK